MHPLSVSLGSNCPASLTAPARDNRAVTADAPPSRCSDMTALRAGILAIFNNAAPRRETEFEEWFQHEHLQERLGVPGFLLGRRHEAVLGEPRYFNFY
jgi:hypothetical protein